MKKNLDVVRAWKDPKYRASLSEDELAGLPLNPAGVIEINDAELGGAHGGTSVVCWVIGTMVFSCAGTCPSEICDANNIYISA